MTKKSFSLIHNLDGLSEEQRAQYLRDFSEHLGLPPDLNALDLIWMDDDNKSGLRKLVVYCRKGTADLLRDIHGVEVQSLEQVSVPGCVAFKATGKNAKGRQEISIGAHDIEGLKGPRLAFAVMTSQSRALRRLTLQFVGGGLLDESEVNTQTTNINRTDASLAQLAGSPTVLPPPQVTPTATPGKDITQSQSATPESVVSLPHPLVSETAKQAIAESNSASITPAISTDNTVSETVKEAVTTPEQTAPKKRRGRGPGKKRNTVDLSSPGQQLAMPPGQIDAQGVIRSADEPSKCLDCGQPLKDHEYVHGKGYICKVSVPPATAKEPEEGANGTGTLPILPLAESSQETRYSPREAADIAAGLIDPKTGNPPSAAPVQTKSAPTRTDPAVIKTYNDRFRVYANDILPNGGMMPSEGLGIWAKLRKFAVVFAGTTDTTTMGAQQWEDLLSFLDDYTAKNGAAQLVAYIHKTLGITQ